MIQMDYACLTERALFKVSQFSEEERDHAVRVIVAHCGGSRSPSGMWCLARPRVRTSVAAEIIVEDIVYLGHTRVILRSDNELALLLLVGDV